MTEQDLLKKQAAERAVGFISSGMVVGLGSGSTMRYVLEQIGALLRDGRLRDIVGVPTSEATAALARQLGIPLTTLDDHPELDLNIDGADEIDPHLNLIKGLGGALLREKIVASAARTFVVVADRSKLVKQLGSKAPVPIEIIPLAQPLIERRLHDLGGSSQLRRISDGKPFVTDEGNHILDYTAGPIADAAQLAAALDSIVGVVEHGLFLAMATSAVVAAPEGIKVLEKT